MRIDNEKDAYAISLILLSILKDRPAYMTTSHLIMAVDRQNFDRLIDTFGGMTFTVPTRDEVNLALKSLLYFQLRYIQGRNQADSLKESGLTLEQMSEVDRYYSEIESVMNSISEDFLNALLEPYDREEFDQEQRQKFKRKKRKK